MKPISVKDPAKFDAILGRLVTTPPEKRADFKAPKKTKKDA